MTTTNILLMSEIWEFGLTVTIIGYSIVLIALVFLYIVYQLIPRIMNYVVAQKLKRAGRKADKVGSPEHTGEINAAIAMAIHMYMNEQHDFESGKLTAKHKSQYYSPWSSKIYSIRGHLNSRI
ncbi:MAG: hypothetical protein CSB01_02395 [Bacteroidia bacterium]|nr:MAG: hypothetical protein CSB01_02395 [Bacteroidia bacterium]